MFFIHNYREMSRPFFSCRQCIHILLVEHLYIQIKLCPVFLPFPYGSLVYSLGFCSFLCSVSSADTTHVKTLRCSEKKPCAHTQSVPSSTSSSSPKQALIYFPSIQLEAFYRNGAVCCGFAVSFSHSAECV